MDYKLEQIKDIRKLGIEVKKIRMKYFFIS